MAAPKLHLVGDDLVDANGEIIPRDVARLQDMVIKLQGDLKAAENDLRTKRRQITELQRDKVRERIDYERYKDVERIAKYWWKKCRASSPRVHYMAPDRFDAVRGLLDMQKIVMVEVNGKMRKQKEPHYTLEDFKQAIDGAAFDPNRKQRKNNTWEIYDDLELICRGSKQFEGFMAKAPVRAPVVAPEPDSRNNP